jgi:hypothetical protein
MKGFCEGEFFFNENPIIFLVYVFETLEFWNGRWNWNKNIFFKQKCYFYAFTMTFVVLVLYDKTLIMFEFVKIKVVHTR